MVVNEFWVPLLGLKNEKLGIRLEKNICRWKEDRNRRGSYYKEEWLEEFLDSKSAFYSGNESDNNDESMEIVMKIMNSSSYRRVLPIVATK